MLIDATWLGLIFVGRYYDEMYLLDGFE